MRKGRHRGRLRLYLCRVYVQTLCPKDALELSLQLLEKVLPLWAQQELGAAWVLQAQHVAADAA